MGKGLERDHTVLMESSSVHSLLTSMAVKKMMVIPPIPSSRVVAPHLSLAGPPFPLPLSAWTIIRSALHSLQNCQLLADSSYLGLSSTFLSD